MHSIIRNLPLGLLLAVSVPPAVSGQGTTTPGTRGRADPVQIEMQRRFETDAIEKMLSVRPQPPSDRERRAIREQIKNDFLRIQVVDDSLKQQAAGAGDLNLNLVAQSAAEIRRCAARLKDNLSLPKVETAPGISENASEDQLRELLSGLSRSISAFVENPVFESAKVVNPNLSAQASQDLEQIIGLSRNVKQMSERLHRVR